MPTLMIATCRWCQAPLKTQKTKECRKCHKKQKPCTRCNGPVGRSMPGPRCKECESI